VNQESDQNKQARKKSKFSNVTNVFLLQGSFLKAFLGRFIHRPQDIEDIAQEAFLRAFKIEQSGEVNHPKSLLFTIAKNIALNELRSKARQVTDYIEECQADWEAETASAEVEVEALDKLKAYCEAVDSLPEQCRRVYLLRKVHGLRQKDIAERLNITVRSVERHLQKGVVHCRAYISDNELSQLNKSQQSERVLDGLSKQENMDG